MTRIKLPGPDGRNLLGFLASIGAFSAIAHQRPEVALSWGTDYRPVLHLPEAGGTWDKEVLLNNLEAGLEVFEDSARFPWKDLTVKPKEFREYAERALQAASLQSRHWIDFVAGLASDAAPVDDKGNVSDTALRTMSGAGHQHFLGFMSDLQEKVERKHLQEALFSEWEYNDRKLSLRWDPLDDRCYALRADDPSKGKHNEIPSMWGANRLAFEALACLPTYPTSRKLVTTGFTEQSNRQKMVIFHWPLWNPPITLDVLRSLLAHRALQDAAKKTDELKALGVFCVVSSRRFTEGRYRNFSPSKVWPVPH